MLSLSVLCGHKLRQKREGPTNCLITLLVIHAMMTQCCHCLGEEDIFFRCFKCYTSYCAQCADDTWCPRCDLGNGNTCMPCYWSSKPCTNPDCPNDVGVPTKRCGGCRRSRYCSKECQIAMWPEHKETCMGVVDGVTETRKEAIAELDGSETTSTSIATEKED